MASGYGLIIQPSAEREMRRLPKADLLRIVRRVGLLSTDPRPPGSKKLAGDVFRVRQGDYRVVYGVNDAARTVTIFKVGHRREVYR